MIALADLPPFSSYPFVRGPHGPTAVAYDGTIAERGAKGPVRGFRALALCADLDPDGTVSLELRLVHI